MRTVGLRWTDPSIQDAASRSWLGVKAVTLWRLNTIFIDGSHGREMTELRFVW